MSVRLSVRKLVETVMRAGSIDYRYNPRGRAEQGTKLHKEIQSKKGPDYSREVSLSIDIKRGGVDYRLGGRTDGIIRNKEGITVDEIKTVTLPVELINEDDHPEFWAQCMCYGYIISKKENLPKLKVSLTYYNVDTDETRILSKIFTEKQLEEKVFDLLDRYRKLGKMSANLSIERNASLINLQFPYDNTRQGQKELMEKVWETISQKEVLFACAPTGIGKTISVLFPSLKKMGDGNIDKIFYFTAKNETKDIAVNAISYLKERNRDLSLKTVVLSAKEDICFLPSPSCTPDLCPYAKNYFDRINDVILDNIEECDLYSIEKIRKIALENEMCPYVLALDLSDWRDLVICDYNYLFSPKASLQRHFAENGNSYVFLIDEAHNLADRVRESCSCVLSSNNVISLLDKTSDEDKEIKSSLKKIADIFKGIKKDLKRDKTEGRSSDEFSKELMKAVRGYINRYNSYINLHRYEPVRSDLQQLYFDCMFCLDLVVSCGRYEDKEIKSSLKKIADVFKGIKKDLKKDKKEGRSSDEFRKELMKAVRGYINRYNSYINLHRYEPVRSDLQQLYFDCMFCLDLVVSCGRYEDIGKIYTYLEYMEGSDTQVKVLCLDPREYIYGRLSCGYASVIFSATLEPMDYYKKMIFENGKDITLASPFPKRNFGLFISPLSTYYKDRDETLDDICDEIYALSSAKTGNYIVYCPSHLYKEKIFSRYSELYGEDFGGQAIIKQERYMSPRARKDFISRFDEDYPHGLLAFCVMGGIYGEGVDLAGDKLIGSAVIGVGLPAPSAEINALSRYYSGLGMNGFDFTGKYPGMNKVMQAAGRVIRTETDKGVVLLIDKRFLNRDYEKIMPEHWENRQYVKDPALLASKLKTFWGN